jgi:putative transcriptional regulator
VDIPVATTRNRLLVSVPATGDDNFDQTVVYVIDHDDDGAIGVVLNRPSDDPVPPVVDIGVPGATPDVLFSGGPVSPEAMIVLGRRRLGSEARGIAAVGGAVAVVAAAAVEDHEVEGIDVVRVYSGYAGWAPRQLDAELAAGVWVVLDALPDDVFCADPARLWRSVLAREGGRLASVARYPSDPNQN